jgi:DNA-binding transcriptional MocR family regulator
MIDSGDVARLGPHAFTIYAVIKAYTNFNNGRSFPSIQLISQKSGISERQVVREIKRLEGCGYISKSRQGRFNIYTLREKVSVTDANGTPQAVASWDYLPTTIQQTVADLKNMLVTGDLGTSKVVNIQKLQVNIQINHAGGNIQLNEADLAGLPKDTRDALTRIKIEMAERKLYT